MHVCACAYRQLNSATSHIRLRVPRLGASVSRIGCAQSQFQSRSRSLASSIDVINALVHTHRTHTTMSHQSASASADAKSLTGAVESMSVSDAKPATAASGSLSQGSNGAGVGPNTGAKSNAEMSEEEKKAAKEAKKAAKEAEKAKKAKAKEAQMKLQEKGVSRAHHASIQADTAHRSDLIPFDSLAPTTTACLILLCRQNGADTGATQRSATQLQRLEQAIGASHRYQTQQCESGSY